jgi:hypothetical protein
MENMVKTDYLILLGKLARINWYDIHVSHYDDHLFQRTFLEEQIRVFYVRRSDNHNQIFRTEVGKFWHLECLKCGTVALKIVVTHPITYALLPLSSRKEYHYETVSYCPVCEKKPDMNGTAISLDRAYR